MKVNRKIENKLAHVPIWEMQIGEVTGRNLEVRGRVIVNRLLREGWVLLHIYTLRYHEDGIWRERPMAILGKLKKAEKAGYDKR